jgi:hypothetical protein
MSWSYSGNPKESPIDEVRFLVGDTNEREPIMQDEEIQYLIDEYGSNENVLRYYVFTHVATIFARDIKRTLGPQSEDPTKRLEYFQKQAQHYEGLLASAGISLPKYAYPKTFRKGMQSNPPWPLRPGKRGEYLV